MTIDVIRYSLKLVDGVYVQDARNNSPAKDGDTYTQEGVYQFTVKNLYTNTEDTSKVIYVGTAPIYKALAKGVYTLDQINAMLSEGGVLEDDGTITMPIPVEDEPVIDEETPDSTESELTEEQIVETEPVSDVDSVPERVTEDVVEIVDEHIEEKNSNHIWILIVVILILSVCAVLAKKKGVFEALLKGTKDKNTNDEEGDK